MAGGRSARVSRRNFLAAGASIAAAAAAAADQQTAAAQTTSTQAAGADPAPVRASTAPLKIIDFHNHYVDPAFPLMQRVGVPPALKGYWERVDRNLADRQALMSSIEAAGIAARVINTPTAFVHAPDGQVPLETIRRINDGLAEMVRKHPGRLYALATIDAFSGEAGARELTRAVRELGLRGAFIESASKDLLPDAPQARSTLAAAAALGVPVFVHPVNDAMLARRFGRHGRLGQQLARGTINAAALVAMLQGGVFDELPNLRVVVTTLAIGGVMLAGAFGDGSRLRSDAPALTRRHVYIDTMGLQPALIRSAVSLLGADHVLVGTDWPIFVEKDVAARLQSALDLCGLDASEQQAVASGNVAKLLGIA